MTKNKWNCNSSEPFYKDAYYEWLEWRNVDYRENYCHKTGERTNYENTMRHPILNSDYENEDVWSDRKDI